jgi:hypothetical protein
MPTTPSSAKKRSKPLSSKEAPTMQSSGSPTGVENYRGDVQTASDDSEDIDSFDDVSCAQSDDNLSSSSPRLERISYPQSQSKNSSRRNATLINATTSETTSYYTINDLGLAKTMTECYMLSKCILREETFIPLSSREALTTQFPGSPTGVENC